MRQYIYMYNAVVTYTGFFFLGIFGQVLKPDGHWTNISINIYRVFFWWNKEWDFSIPLCVVVMSLKLHKYWCGFSFRSPIKLVPCDLFQHFGWHFVFYGFRCFIVSHIWDITKLDQNCCCFFFLNKLLLWNQWVCHSCNKYNKLC